MYYKGLHFGEHVTRNVLWPDDDALALKHVANWDYIRIWKVNKTVVMSEYLNLFKDSLVLVPLGSTI
jgi:hypothetical protein